MQEAREAAERAVAEAKAENNEDNDVGYYAYGGSSEGLFRDVHVLGGRSKDEKRGSTLPNLSEGSAALLPYVSTSRADMTSELRAKRRRKRARAEGGEGRPRRGEMEGQLTRRSGSLGAGNQTSSTPEMDSGLISSSTEDWMPEESGAETSSPEGESLSETMDGSERDLKSSAG